MPVPKEDITGRKFAYLTVIESIWREDRKETWWRCRCDCGNEALARVGDLKRGDRISCGCMTRKNVKKHGLSNSPEYKSWDAMRQRCNNPRNDNYKNYGARGIRVDPRWEDFNNFYEDMGPKPFPTASIDRINGEVEGLVYHYTKENCRWSSSAEQRENQIETGFRDEVPITYQGVTQSINGWSKTIGISHTTIIKRLQKGLPLEEVFQPTATSFHLKEMESQLRAGETLPKVEIVDGRAVVPHCRRTFITAHGVTKHIDDWVKEVSVSKRQIERRLKEGMSPEEALKPSRMKNKTTVTPVSQRPPQPALATSSAPGARGVGRQIVLPGRE